MNSGRVHVAGSAAEGSGPVDELRAEFESVDGFLQALLGVRSACLEFDDAFDRLVGLGQGSTSAWARAGEVPAADSRALDGASSASGASAGSDDLLCGLLGLVAMRRAIEGGFEVLVRGTASSRDGGSEILGGVRCDQERAHPAARSLLR